MPKPRQDIEVIATNPEPKRDAWPVAAIYHLRFSEVEPLQEGDTWPRIAEELANCLWNESPKAAGLEGYLAFVLGGSHALAEERNVSRFLPVIAPAFSKLVAEAMGKLGGRLPWDKSVSFEVEGDQFDGRVFTDTNLARLELNVHSCQNSMSNSTSMPESPTSQESSPTKHGSSRLELLDALMKTVPADLNYEQQIQEFKSLSESFRQKIASNVLPALKREIESKTISTIENKKDLVKWVNSELRPLGLSIRHPKTGLPATFVADPGNHPETGRFQLRSEGKTFSTPDISTLLDNLELMEAPQREEGLAKWADRVEKPSASVHSGRRKP